MDRLQRLVHEKRRPEVVYTNKFAWSVLPDGSWQDKPCFIVGGGPSLAKFNWDLLKGKLTIAINRAYEMFDPTIIFGMDPSFVRHVLMNKYGDRARTKFKQSSATKIWVNGTGINLPDDIYVLKYWQNYLKGRRAFPLTMKEGIGHGNNSGYGALNLAACLGANPIYLLGYDMKHENGKTHWHDGHPKQPPDHVPGSFKEHFTTAAEILKTNEISVINLNPDSALNCFPKMEISTGFNPPIKVKTKEKEKDKPPRPVMQSAFSDVVVDNAWKGLRCFIIGEGASLKHFDLSRLESELTIGVNRTYEKLGCTIMFATNAEYHKWIIEGKMGARAERKFEEFNGHKVWLGSQNYGLKEVNHLMELGGTGFSSSLKKGLVSNGSPEYGALNLAICLGANPIYLLGFDMHGENGKQPYWHDGYPKDQSDTVYAKFKTYFEGVAPTLKKKGIKVINLNPASELKCFDFGDIKDFADPLGKYMYHAGYDSTKLIRYEHDTLYFKGALGFGDNFYQRQIIKDLAKSYKTIHITTALPEMYWDIPNVKFAKSTVMYKLRTHKKRMEALPAETWSPKPDKKDSDSVYVALLHPPVGRNLRTKYIELENRKDFDFTFPVKNEWVEKAKKLVKTLPLKGKKLCIIRRPTCRTEWNCPARNPKVEYYQLLIDKYKDEYFFVGIADVEKEQEWFDGDIHGLDKEFNKGEIDLPIIFGLMKIADMTITYPSLFMIAAIAIRTKCFCLFGGCGMPDTVLRRGWGLQNFGYVAPEPFCNCINMNHDCKKDMPPKKIIKAFEELRERKKYIKSVTVGCCPGIGDSHWAMTKMQSFKEKLAIDELKVVVRRDPVHHYTADFLKMIPFIDEIVAHPSGLNYMPLYNKDAPAAITKEVDGCDYMVDPGALMWLKGTLLEDILPNYDTNFHYPIVFPKSARQEATRIKKENKGKVVIFFASSIMSNNDWNKGAWSVKNWVALAGRIFKHTGVRPILIGAEWDKTYAELIRGADTENVIQYRVGEMGIEQTLCLLREANLVVAFPCGIPIMATYFGIPTVMFWPLRGISRRERFDPAFQFTWAPPESRNNGRYIPAAYDAPDTNPTEIFNRTRRFL